MAKENYRFNNKSLQFEKVQKSFKIRFLKVLYTFSLGLVFAAVIIFLSYTFLDSPKEKVLKREIAQYELQFQILNDRLIRISNVLADMQDRE